MTKQRAVDYIKEHIIGYLTDVGGGPLSYSYLRGELRKSMWSEAGVRQALDELRAEKEIEDFDWGEGEPILYLTQY